MARKPPANQAALATLAGAGGGVVRAGYDAKAQAVMAKELIERTRARAVGAMKQAPVVVADGKGLSHVEMVEMPDEPLRQRADEHLTSILGLEPSRSQHVAVNNILQITIKRREPPAFVEATVKVIEP
jgi:hypothetical protein